MKLGGFSCCFSVQDPFIESRPPRAYSQATTLLSLHFCSSQEHNSWDISSPIELKDSLAEPPAPKSKAPDGSGTSSSAAISLAASALRPLSCAISPCASASCFLHRSLRDNGDHVRGFHVATCKQDTKASSVGGYISARSSCASLCSSSSRGVLPGAGDTSLSAIGIGDGAAGLAVNGDSSGENGPDLRGTRPKPSAPPPSSLFFSWVSAKCASHAAEGRC